MLSDAVRVAQHELAVALAAVAQHNERRPSDPTPVLLAQWTQQLSELTEARKDAQTCALQCQQNLLQAAQIQATTVQAQASQAAASVSNAAAAPSHARNHDSDSVVGTPKAQFRSVTFPEPRTRY